MITSYQFRSDVDLKLFISEHLPRSYRRVCAFVVKNNMQAAIIAIATTVDTVCVFQPACTNAARRLYLDIVLM